MITKTAWKNIWRNKMRSIVVIASVTVGIFSGVFAIGVMEGMMGQRVDAALKNEVSHIQISHPDFRANNDMIYCVNDYEKLKERLLQTEGVENVCSRLIITGMANSASKSQGVQINGIVAEDEKKVFELYDKIYPESGSYFNDEKGMGYAYVGVDLAKSLGIIRYIIDDEAISNLREKDVPETVLSKIEEIKGKRFRSENLFKKNLKKILDKEDMNKFGNLTRDEAQSFSRRARLTLTFLDKDNYQTGGRFRIVGLYDIPNSMYELMQVFVMADELRALSGLPENISHQVVVKLNDKEQSKELADKLTSDLPDLEVMTWQQLQPDLAMMSEMTIAMYAFFMVIILAALAFGIVNTMLMVVLERTRELGMLTAIGMNKKKVFRMIMTESVFLSLTGGIVGMILSNILIVITAKKGLSVASMKEGFEGMGFSVDIYPAIEPNLLILVTLLIIITGILASIYPALKALKLDPAEAIRTE
jgi:ABC-type lipoprotein release transport system permease subunit